MGLDSYFRRLRLRPLRLWRRWRRWRREILMGIIGIQENLRLTSFILQMGFFFNIVFVVKILANKVDISPKSTFSLVLIGSFKGFKGSYKKKIILISSMSISLILPIFRHFSERDKRTMPLHIHKQEPKRLIRSKELWTSCLLPSNWQQIRTLVSIKQILCRINKYLK